MTRKEVETLDYTPEAIARHKPKAFVDRGKLYIDGIEVYEWQLTDEEMKHYFPEKWQRKHKIWTCPICSKDLTSAATADNRGWTTHVRTAHAEWYEKNRELMQACKSHTEFNKMVEEEKATRPQE